MPVQNIAAKQTTKVSTGLLDFDAANPRLIEDGIKNPTESQIILSLADTADLAEVVESIAANGYIDIEPIIAQQTGARWRVLEGNRRLAAIRILQKPALASGTLSRRPDSPPIGIATTRARASPLRRSRVV